MDLNDFKVYRFRLFDPITGEEDEGNGDKLYALLQPHEQFGFIEGLEAVTGSTAMLQVAKSVKLEPMEAVWVSELDRNVVMLKEAKTLQ